MKQLRNMWRLVGKAVSFLHKEIRTELFIKTAIIFVLLYSTVISGCYLMERAAETERLGEEVAALREWCRTDIKAPAAE